MRLLCPYCQQKLEHPDSDAGKTVSCQYCSQKFLAPMLSAHIAPMAEPAPVPAPPAPAPSYQGPLSNPSGIEETVFPVPKDFMNRPAAKPVGWTSIALESKLLSWFTPALLTIALLLTFFSWNGLYFGGHAAYTQSGWGCLFAGLSSDEVAEDLFKDEELGKKLSEGLRSTWWLLPYFPMLFVELAIAWAGVLVTALKLAVSPPIDKVWAYRPAFLGILALFLFLFLSTQWSSGFGLKRAVRDRAEKLIVKEDPSTPEKIKRWEMKTGMEESRFGPQTTLWLRLLWLCHLTVLLVLALEFLLMYRGKKPAPRIGIMV